MTPNIHTTSATLSQVLAAVQGHQKMVRDMERREEVALERDEMTATRRKLLTDHGNDHDHDHQGQGVCVRALTHKCKCVCVRARARVSWRHTP